MQLLTVKEYFMGRDTEYAANLTQEITSNAFLTVGRANAVLSAFYQDTPRACIRPVNSGWRPPAINNQTQHAAVCSRHLTGQAIDLGDDDRALANWCLSVAGQAALVSAQCWMEHPASTPRWVHLQIVPPASGRRVFHP